MQKSIIHTWRPCTSANRYYCCKNDVTQWGVEHQYICSTYNRPCFGDAARRQEPKIYGFQSIIFKNKNLFIKGHISPKQCLQNLIETFENYLKKQYLYSTTTECVCVLYLAMGQMKQKLRIINDDYLIFCPAEFCQKQPFCTRLKG